jgi:glycerol kinase
VGLRTGLFGDTGELESRWRLEKRFEPTMHPDTASALYAGWKAAVERVKTA